MPRFKIENDCRRLHMRARSGGGDRTRRSFDRCGYLWPCGVYCVVSVSANNVSLAKIIVKLLRNCTASTKRHHMSPAMDWRFRRVVVTLLCRRLHGADGVLQRVS